MKKLLTHLIFLFTGLSTFGSPCIQNYLLEFSESDYSLRYDEKGQLVIASATVPIAHPDVNSPCLPMVAKDIAIERDLRYSTSKISFSRRLIKTNVTMAPVQLPVPTSDTTYYLTTRTLDFGNKTYPESNFSYVATSAWDQMSVLHFLACPFLYDAEKKHLYFLDSINVELTLDDASQTVDNIRCAMPKDLRNDNLINPGTADLFLSQAPSESSAREKIDYLVITSSALARAFAPLINWKTTKGLYCKVTSVEQINATYDGVDLPEKIRKYIKHLKNTHGLKYVLLGGDDTIVPTRECYGSVLAVGNQLYNDLWIPTDLYYACLNGTWNANGNNLYGEVDDEVDMAQQVYVTRLPIRSKADLNDYLIKLIDYERNPRVSNRMLLGGTKTHAMASNGVQSDAELHGDLLRDSSISPFWDGTVVKFFDTATDFEGGSNYDFTAGNLAAQIQNGFDFINIQTHGSEISFLMEDKGHYNVNHGMAQSSSAYSVITTTACQTNAFDSAITSNNAEPCLSESLIRNPNSGVIAYLGSSRTAWGSTNDHLGRTMQYMARFYSYLFNPYYIPYNHFGEIMAAVKNDMIGMCRDNAYRWLQYSINPIGDPETTLYTSTPLEFNNISLNKNANGFSLDTGFDGSNVCLTDWTTSTPTIKSLHTNTRQLELSELPDDFTICITGYHYIPKVIKVTLLQNEEITTDLSIDSDFVYMGEEVNPNKSQGPIIIKGGTVSITASEIELAPGTIIEQGSILELTTK